jgi:hypothetical protein
MEHPLDLRRLEELGLNSSAPPGQLLYGGWLLRLLPGQAKRARSVNAIYPSSLASPDKIAYCEHLYRARGIPLIFRITPFSEPAGLDSTLERMGLPRFDTTAVESTRIDPARLPAASTEPLALADWVQAVGDCMRTAAAPSVTVTGTVDTPTDNYQDPAHATNSSCTVHPCPGRLRAGPAGGRSVHRLHPDRRQPQGGGGRLR